MAHFVDQHNVKFPGQDVGYGDRVDLSGYDDSRIQQMLESGTISESPNTGPFPRSDDGGWFDLSTGERCQGREAAEEAQALIDSGQYDSLEDILNDESEPIPVDALDTGSSEDEAPGGDEGSGDGEEE